MKVKENVANAIKKALSVDGELIVKELNYVMGDICSYDELTCTEKKEIWTKENFEKIFE